MNKVSFLFGVITIAFGSLLTSCFSSGGEIQEPNIPHKDGFSGSMVSTDGTNYIECKSTIQGLKGECTVPKEAAQVLINKGWGGILIILGYYMDENFVSLSDPLAIQNHEFDAQTIVASCYPDGMDFKGNHVTLEILTNEARDTEVYRALKGTDEWTRCTATDRGVRTDLPHFCDWIFKIRGRVTVESEEYIKSDSIETKCAANSSYTVRAEAKYGFETSCTNPFVLSYLNNLIGEKKTTQFEWSAYSQHIALIKVVYRQKVLHCKITSGEQTFDFTVYGKPVYFTHSDKDLTHLKGEGSN